MNYSSDEEDFWPGEEGLLQKHLCTPDDTIDTRSLQAVNDVRCRYKPEDFQLDNNNIVIHNDKFRYQMYDPFTRKSIPREYSHTFTVNNRKEIEPGRYLCTLDDHSGWTCSLKAMRSADMKSHHDSFLPHRCLECGKFVSGSGAIRRHLYTHEWKTRWSACKVLPERKRTSFDYTSKPFVSQVEPPFLRPKVKKVVTEPPMNVIDPRDQPKALRQQRGNKFDPSDFHIDDKHIIQMRGNYRYQIYDPVTRRSVPKEWSEHFSSLHRVQVRQDKYLCSMPDHAGRPCAGKLRTLAEIRKHHKDNLPHRCLICNRFRSGLKSIRVHFHLHGLSHLYNKRSDSEVAGQSWTSQRAKKVATNRLTLKSNLSHRLVNRKDPKIALAHWKITNRAMYPKPRALIPRWPMSCKQPAVTYKELESESEEEDMNPLANPDPTAKILFKELSRAAPASGKNEAPKPVTRQGHPALRRVTSVTSSSPRNPIQNQSHSKPVKMMGVSSKPDAKPDQLALQERMRELEAEMAKVRQSLSKIDNNSQASSNKRPSGTSQIKEDNSVDSGMNCLSNTSLSESNEIICASQIPSHISMKKDIDDLCLAQDRHELSAHSSQISDYATNSSEPHSPRMRDYDQSSGQPSPQNSDSLEERFFSHTPGKTKFTPSDFFLSNDNIFNVDGRPSYQVYNPISRKPMCQEDLDRFMDENVVCDESGRYSCGFPYHQGKECSKKACEKPRVIKGHLEHSLPCRCMICDEFHVAIGMVRMHIRRRHPGCRVKGQ